MAVFLYLAMPVVCVRQCVIIQCVSSIEYINTSLKISLILICCITVSLECVFYAFNFKNNEHFHHLIIYSAFLYLLDDIGKKIN